MREAREVLCASNREATEHLDASYSTRETASSVRSLATPEDLDTPESAEFTEDIV